MSNLTFTFYCIPGSTLVLLSLQVFTEHLLYTRVYSGLSTYCIPGSTVVSSQQIPYLILNFSVLVRISYMLLLIS